MLYREEMHRDQLLDKDLVIAVGGDGTVLNSASFLSDKIPLLGRHGGQGEGQGGVASVLVLFLALFLAVSDIMHELPALCPALPCALLQGLTRTLRVTTRRASPRGRCAPRLP